MRRTSIFLAALAVMMISRAGPIKEGDEIDSYEAAFHHMLHDSAEFYLICIYDVKKKPWKKGWKEQLEIKATVIESIKGEKKVGDRIEYQRVLEGNYGDISHPEGSLCFVRLITDDAEGTKPFVDAQDPQSDFRYSPDFHHVARKHKAEQDAAGQPVIRPESK